MKDKIIQIFAIYYVALVAWNTYAAEVTIDNNVVTVHGNIIPGDASKLQKLLVQQPPQIGSKLIINLNSSGGQTSSANRFFDFLRWLSLKGVHITTLVPSGASCDSACVMIFAAGDERRAAPFSTFLLHPVTLAAEPQKAKEIYLKTIRSADHNFYSLIIKNKWLEHGENLFYAFEINEMSPSFLKVDGEGVIINTLVN